MLKSTSMFKTRSNVLLLIFSLTTRHYRLMILVGLSQLKLIGYKFLKKVKQIWKHIQFVYLCLDTLYTQTYFNTRKQR